MEIDDDVYQILRRKADAHDGSQRAWLWAMLLTGLIMGFGMAISSKDIFMQIFGLFIAGASAYLMTLVVVESRQKDAPLPHQRDSKPKAENLQDEVVGEGGKIKKS